MGRVCAAVVVGIDRGGRSADGSCDGILGALLRFPGVVNPVDGAGLRFVKRLVCWET